MNPTVLSSLHPPLCPPPPEGGRRFMWPGVLNHKERLTEAGTGSTDCRGVGERFLNPFSRFRGWTTIRQITELYTDDVRKRRPAEMSLSYSWTVAMDSLFLKDSLYGRRGLVSTCIHLSLGRMTNIVYVQTKYCRWEKVSSDTAFSQLFFLLYSFLLICLHQFQSFSIFIRTH